MFGRGGYGYVYVSSQGWVFQKDPMLEMNLIGPVKLKGEVDLKFR